MLATRHDHVIRVCHHRVPARSTADRVRCPVSRVDGVVGTPAGDAVATGSGYERVVPSETTKPVVARLPDDDVVPAASGQRVIPTRSLVDTRAARLDRLSYRALGQHRSSAKRRGGKE
jgi:hypothetical protein